ncbi:MAG: cation:proton antiporter, partial [Nostoc sp.]
LPQVGTTLAATLVGYRAGLLPLQVLHSVIVLMVVTSTLGPLMTSRIAVGLNSSPAEDPTPPLSDQNAPETDCAFTLVVPVYNPQTEQYLIELAALLARQSKGK